jgi:ATP-dependent Clp protease adaptor protein ClpS
MGKEKFGGQEHHENGEGLAVEHARPRLKRPKLFKVLLMNDDFTPMDFVVDVLERLFRMDRVNATRVMLQVHTQGKGVCGVFSKDVAETRVGQVNQYARSHNHPLLCVMEEA